MCKTTCPNKDVLKTTEKKSPLLSAEQPAQTKTLSLAEEPVKIKRGAAECRKIPFLHKRQNNLLKQRSAEQHDNKQRLAEERGKNTALLCAEQPAQTKRC